MKKAPMRNVRVIHSFMPQRFTRHSAPLRCGWNRSAAQTPIWQVTDDSTRTVVLTMANGRLSFSVWMAHSSGTVARSVKYIANRPAKNMSSLASQTIVPTDTGFGRFTLTWVAVWGAAVAVDTIVSMADIPRAWVLGPASRPAAYLTLPLPGVSACRRDGPTRTFPGVPRCHQDARRQARATTMTTAGPTDAHGTRD